MRHRRLRAADPRLRVRLVHARTGKVARAEPVAHLFEAGRAVLHGRMPELEAQLLGMIADGGYEVLHPTKGWRRVCGKRARLYA